jgi:biopolymer transport protein ExbD
MGANTNLDGDDGITDINITPLVDVMMVLLIIFLVASAYIVKETIEVELPKAAKTTETVETTLSIILDKYGSLYLNGKPSNEAMLAQACKEAAVVNPNAQAIIAADNDVRHGNVVRLIDIVRTNGLSRFAINVKHADGAVAAGPAD